MEVQVNIDLSKWSWLTILACAVVSIVVLGGAVDTVVGNITFEAYLAALTSLAKPLAAAVAVARGIHFAGRDRSAYQPPVIAPPDPGEVQVALPAPRRRSPAKRKPPAAS
jgi:hypothetical protein